MIMSMTEKTHHQESLRVYLKPCSYSHPSARLLLVSTTRRVEHRCVNWSTKNSGEGTCEDSQVEFALMLTFVNVYNEGNIVYSPLSAPLESSLPSKTCGCVSCGSD